MRFDLQLHSHLVGFSTSILLHHDASAVRATACRGRLHKRMSLDVQHIRINMHHLPLLNYAHRLLPDSGGFVINRLDTRHLAASICGLEDRKIPVLDDGFQPSHSHMPRGSHCVQLIRSCP